MAKTAVKEQEVVDASSSMIPEELIKELSAPFDPKDIKERVGWTTKGGKEVVVKYVEWSTVVERLNEVCPAWSATIISATQQGSQVVVHMNLEINGITRSGIGIGKGSDEKAWKGAASDAIKRAAVNFGVALNLYENDENTIYQDKTGSVGTAAKKTKKADKHDDDENGASLEDSDEGWQDFELTWGKHQGKTLGEVPADYLKWLCEKYEPKPYKGSISAKDKKFREVLDDIDPEEYAE